MRTGFDRIYRELFEDYIRNSISKWRYYIPLSDRYDYRYYQEEVSYFFEYTARVIHKIGEQINLREDAKYFLLINFCEMIINPILLEGSYFSGNEEGLKRISAYDFLHGRRERSLNFDLRQYIDHDIHMIAEFTYQESERGISLSGHKIMGIINKYWKELKTTRLEVWGE